MKRAGVAVWSAAPARAAVAARGRDDDEGCAGPAASPARRWRSPVVHPSGSRVTEWRHDVEHLNGLLRSGLTFHVEADGGRERAAVGAQGRGPRARGVLVMALDDGRRRVAACAVAIVGSERGRRLSMSRGLSECAMALGLGVGVYRRRTWSGSAPRTERPGSAG